MPPMKCDHDKGKALEITLKDSKSGDVLAYVGYWCTYCGAFYFVDETDWRLPTLIRSKTAN